MERLINSVAQDFLDNMDTIVRKLPYQIDSPIALALFKSVEYFAKKTGYLKDLGKLGKVGNWVTKISTKILKKFGDLANIAETGFELFLKQTHGILSDVIMILDVIGGAWQIFRGAQKLSAGSKHAEKVRELATELENWYLDLEPTLPQLIIYAACMEG